MFMHPQMSMNLKPLNLAVFKNLNNFKDMTALCTITSLLGLSLGVSSTQVFVVNDALAEKPPDTYLLTFNTTDNPTLKAYDADFHVTIRGNAIFCNDNTYYAIWYYEKIFAGFFTYNISNQQSEEYSGADQDGVLNLGCSSLRDVIFTITVAEPPDTGIQLWYWNFTGGAGGPGQLVATLPSEYDYNFGGNIFSFNSDSTELWVSAMHKKSSQGTLLIVDTMTGMMSICIHLFVYIYI